MQALSPIARRAAAILLVAAGACGGDATAPTPSNALRSDEAADLAVAMGLVLSGTGGAPATANVAASVAYSTVPISYAMEQTLPCPSGGTIHVKGSVNGQYDAASQSMSMDVTATQEPKDCGMPVKALTFTTSGAPNLSTTAHMEIKGGQPAGAFTSSTKGGFSWKASDGRSGSCSVDYTSKADFTAGTVQVTGSFCGTSLSYSGPLTH